MTRLLAYDVREYPRGEMIYSPDEYKCEVGFVLSGECEVTQHAHDDGKIILNTLRVGDSFGVLAVFNPEERFPTQVYARKNSKILFIARDELMRMIEASPKVAMNVIEFLARRVSFLNRRIGTVSRSTVDSKLASFLLGESRRLSSDEMTLNMKRCSETIGAGRTSVYRSLKKLENSGYIAADSKIITIIDKCKLEELTK